jgi:hypothetical protein
VVVVDDSVSGGAEVAVVEGREIDGPPDSPESPHEPKTAAAAIAAATYTNRRPRGVTPPILRDASPTDVTRSG